MNNEKDRILNQLKEKGIEQDLFGNDLSNTLFAPQETIKEKNDKDPSKKAYDYAIRILSIKDYSSHKMRTKLQDRNYESEIVESVIQKLIDQKYIRDEEFTLMRIKQLVVKGYGNHYILQKLSQEKLNASLDQIENLRFDQNLDEDSQIDYLIQKKLRSKEIPNDFESKMKLKNKITRFLISKGFNFSQINNLLNKYID